MSQGVNHPEMAQLQAENEHLRAMLDEKDARIEDLRSAMRLLTDQREPAPKSFWAKLIGRS